MQSAIVCSPHNHVNSFYGKHGTFKIIFRSAKAAYTEDSKIYNIHLHILIKEYLIFISYIIYILHAYTCPELIPDKDFTKFKRKIA